MRIIETPLEQLSTFIGDYSQNVYFCSYNDDSVRDAWLRGDLTKEANQSDEFLWRDSWPKYNKDTDLDKVCSDLVRKTGCWPTVPGGHCFNWLDYLTDAEKDMLGRDTIFNFEDTVKQIAERVKNSKDPFYYSGILLKRVYRNKYGFLEK